MLTLKDSGLLISLIFYAVLCAVTTNVKYLQRLLGVRTACSYNLLSQV